MSSIVFVSFLRPVSIIFRSRSSRVFHSIAENRSEYVAALAIRHDAAQPSRSINNASRPNSSRITISNSQNRRFLLRFDLSQRIRRSEQSNESQSTFECFRLRRHPAERRLQRCFCIGFTSTRSLLVHDLCGHIFAFTCRSDG